MVKYFAVAYKAEKIALSHSIFWFVLLFVNLRHFLSL